jgi:integrase
VSRRKAGEPLEGPRRSAPTLASAWPLYRHAPRKNGKPRSTRTNEAYAAALERISDTIRNRPLRDLGHEPSVVMTEINRIRRDRGPAAATQTAGFIRLIYQFARRARLDKAMPAGHPCELVATTDEKTQQPVLNADMLPGWWRQVLALRNPVHRPAHLFALLSGLRASEFTAIKWVDVSFEDRSLLIPNPKGGKDRAFVLPLSQPP